MGDVINLARARKRKQRQAQERQADANALAFGRTKDEKLRDRLERAHQQALLDGARLELERKSQRDDTSDSPSPTEP